MASQLEQEEALLASYALKATERCGLEGFRREPDPRDKEGNVRSPYQRDKDRIIWSKAFKRLQHKTQIFPHYVQDHYRRRLTHSLEVAGIACSLARRLHVNEIASEAIALAHDIGHT